MFGCLCFPWIKPYTSHKLDAKSTPCVFLGYSITQSAYFCLDRSTSRIYTSRHVVLHEHVFPFSLPSHIESNETEETEISTYPSVKLVLLITTSTGHVSQPQAHTSDHSSPLETNTNQHPTRPTQRRLHMLQKHNNRLLNLLPSQVLLVWSDKSLGPRNLSRS